MNVKQLINKLSKLPPGMDVRQWDEQSCEYRHIDKPQIVKYGEFDELVFITIPNKQALK